MRRRAATSDAAWYHKRASRRQPQRAARCVAVALLAGLLLASCGRKPKVRLPPPRPARVGDVERGVASWYGHPYHGRRTSNGEVYDMFELTAAHPSLPFDTWLRVKNLKNGRSVEVRVNDRGPFKKKRVVDLSYEAARRIGMVGPGTARVELRVVAPPEANDRPAETGTAATGPGPAACPPGPYYGVQVGSFADRENARQWAQQMAQRYGAVQTIAAGGGSQTLYRVVVGPSADPGSARALLERLKDDGVDGFLLLVDERGAEACEPFS